MTNLACGACFSSKIFFLIILGCIWFEVSYSVYHFVSGKNDSREAFKRTASVDMIRVTRRNRDSREQTARIKQSLPCRYVFVGFQLNSDQALRLLCLKGHVRVHDSTLWRYRWQEASEFLCSSAIMFTSLNLIINSSQAVICWNALCTLVFGTKICCPNLQTRL